MPNRRSFLFLALIAGALVAAASCADPSPTGVASFAKGGRWGTRGTGQPNKSGGLVACMQTYDSVTQVVGPMGGLIAVGNHYLWIDSLTLRDTVSITAVAPADTVRWVRFSPDGLQFDENRDEDGDGDGDGAGDGDGYGAIIYTDFSDCGSPTTDSLRIAQLTDSLKVIRYLQAPDSTWIKVRKNAWSNSSQYVAGVLHHFSQYGVSW
jgi:hypothetical protein